MDFLEIPDSGLFLTEIFLKRPLQPWCELVSKGKRMHFQIQTSHKVRKTRFDRFTCAIVHEFLVIQDSYLLLAEIFHGRLL